MSGAVSRVRHRDLMEQTSLPLPAHGSALVVHGTIDPVVFANLYDHYFPLIHKYVLYRVRDTQTTDDLTAQIFERTLDDLGNYRPEQAPFGAWLFGIARHVVGDHFRTEKRHSWLSLEGLLHLASQGPQPEEIAVRSELSERLLAALARLSSRDRDLIGLKFAAGLNNRQIAALTGLSESNVGVIFYRAMQHLRAEMSEEDIHHE